MTETVANLAVEVSARTEDARARLQELETLGERFAGRLGRSFERVALDGAGLRDVLQNLAVDLSRIAFRSALAPIEGAFSSALSGLTGSVLPFARGGGLQQAMPVPFADGGVISAPVAFPLRGGRTGLAGEAGPEAILPLSRGRDGRLGVRAEAADRPSSITINISTPDIEGFRQSQGELSAQIARAVSRGQRNL
jgi:phage-related minor tail protein